ncbi:MAG: Rid family detoxifying hydrolase [Coriobacteriaceae bacterium]|uniref:RidA family protein n=1 Tax=Tractidigestivibacter sp. TaxID=2847320 RepID=UPI002A837E5A|nr:Rid family detoxifying hydrolase [Tractidigestivibacter sp.]MCI6273860.1 Rid family detoxifying hydrolase [Coriobacteriaceae bacterium]MCI6547024.1 Rid family detoxifying hydrolase [Coriobacteriaceae bacterium]MCI6844669.1 Rid family detoxifying hydrolase [Coriobacteriaceae bacterium]MCI7437838.1 Rid family detoxifying hydrolase [Coriobacteriaceae bacterium]MDD7583397.1 Rid family detoxifying hydrolase [Coriobacteriaceae bacterium]
MKYAINAAQAPDAYGSCSQGTTAGRFVYASGQLPVGRDGKTIVGDSVATQVSHVIDNIEAILAEVGCSLSDVAQTTVYLTRIEDFDAMDRVFAKRFPQPAPARSVVAVSALPLGALVEMDCVACR